MTKKQTVDRIAAQSLIDNIDAVERKLRMMKQYINPQSGTVSNIQVVSGLLHGADECMKNVNNMLVKFI